ncbi:hypothetical protein TIFTF001_003671 [Ficus carica]|uniref:Homeobox domain-containing protein n=1 Tax=Ficus carica TaxID=3494 RepID=A0AA88CUL9_FICCA|nr:hypothetical protein TIFTF001_003671 [Ficus carica]
MMGRGGVGGELSVSGGGGGGDGGDRQLKAEIVTHPLYEQLLAAHGQYLIILCTFKEQLQQHVRIHAVEAVMACREIENTLQALTGVSLGEGTGATMSDDEDDLQMDFSLDQSGADGHDMMGFGPLLPTESERSLMERVRHELKIELKQEDDKAKLVEETGLQLKQINNWFINQRKRNWHSNSQSITSLKSKRKR